MSSLDGGEQPDGNLHGKLPAARSSQTGFTDSEQTHDSILNGVHVCKNIKVENASPPQKAQNLLDLPIDILEVIVREVSSNQE